MKIFIAGATGALGLPLVRELDEVVGMTRAPQKRPLLEHLAAASVAPAGEPYPVWLP